MCYSKYLSIYMNFEGVQGGGVYGLFHISRLQFIKTEKT